MDGVCFGKTNRGSLESFEPGSVPWALFSSLPNHSLAVLGGVMRWIILQGGGSTVMSIAPHGLDLKTPSVPMLWWVVCL